MIYYCHLLEKPARESTVEQMIYYQMIYYCHLLEKPARESTVEQKQVYCLQNVGLFILTNTVDFL